MATPRRGHVHPIGARVKKRLQQRGYRCGIVQGHTWVVARTKAGTRMPYYIVLFDDSNKPESVSASMLVREDGDISERLF
jgi:hypothetical protein